MFFLEISNGYEYNGPKEVRHNHSYTGGGRLRDFPTTVEKENLFFDNLDFISDYVKKLTTV